MGFISLTALCKQANGHSGVKFIHILFEKLRDLFFKEEKIPETNY